MKVLIAGGGIGGITAALCLAHSGHEVEIFEQAHAFDEVGAGIQLSPNCTRVLHWLGLEEALRARAFLPEGTQFRGWKSGNVISENALGNTALKRYGYPYYHMHRCDLMNVLVEAAAREPGIELKVSSNVEGYTEAGNRIQLQVNGQAFDGDVLIGADGIHSVIRSVIWGEENPYFTGNVAWRALVPSKLLPAGLIRPMSTVWWGPKKHFVHYFVRRGELVNCVCVVEKSGWEVESWTEAGDHGELKADFAGWHEDVQMLIEHADPGSLFKWALYDRPPMQAWGKGHATLLGDACHPTLPFMAQGAAMAIEDSAVLAGCLESDTDVAASLRRYEDLRRNRTAGIQNGSRRNAALFHLTGIKAWARNRGAGLASGRAMDKLYRYNAFDVARG